MLLFIHQFKNVLEFCCESSELILNALSLLFILGGLVDSFRKTTLYKRNKEYNIPLQVIFRKSFGSWLVVALELQLGADIIATIKSPTYEHLIQLAAVAIIRTFLNYFLNKELVEQNKIIHELKIPSNGDPV